MQSTMGNDLKDKTVRGVAWSFVERFSVQGVTFALELIIARLVGPENFGLIAMLAIFMSVSQVFIDGGFSSALIQRQERSEADFSTVFYINIAISLVLYAALFVGAPAIARFFNQPILEPVTESGHQFVSCCQQDQADDCCRLQNAVEDFIFFCLVVRSFRCVSGVNGVGRLGSGVADVGERCAQCPD